MKPDLTVNILVSEAESFADLVSNTPAPALYGVTDGKKVGTTVEHNFKEFLYAKYTFEKGSSGLGIDFPGLNVDMKVTSIKQPQSSSPFESARQKVVGLGYALLVFVYSKTDDHQTRTGLLEIPHTIFIEKTRTADYQISRGIREIISRDGSVEDLVAFMMDRNLPIDDTEAVDFAKELIERPPHLGYLTISNALQWRLNYKRAIQQAGEVTGLKRIV